jgi:hypothetical protein
MRKIYFLYIFHGFSEARDHILILNILFFNKLRQKKGKEIIIFKSLARSGQRF